MYNKKGGKQLDLPHSMAVLKEYAKLKFIRKDLLEQIDMTNVKELTEVRNRLVFENYRISMKKLRQLPTKRHPHENRQVAYMYYDKLVFPLILRHRQPGDRFHPLGMRGNKKLKDFFIDEKVSKFDRDKVIIMCDQKNIAWIFGMRVDQRFAISVDTKNILMMKYEIISPGRPRAARRKRQ